MSWQGWAMHVFRLWSPQARGVTLHLQDAERGLADVRAMTAQDDGWWQLEVAEAGHGTDYAFAVDHGDGPGAPRPDPRTRWQPRGVHAASRVFDPTRHRWSATEATWASQARDLLGAVFYEMHVGTFTAEGTLAAATERLDHLVCLGVDVVEVLPVAPFEGERGWGYDGVAPYGVHEAYGGPAALQAFVEACHARGLAVCLDVVYNHLGPAGNYLAEIGPYFSRTHSTPWGPAVNLDGEYSAGVRRWVIDNALAWFGDFHLDCLRLDAVHSLVDDSPQHILAELSDEVAALAEQLGRPLTLIAESDLNDPATVEPTTDGGLGMHAQWSDDLHHALHAWITSEKQGYYADFGDELTVARTLTRVFRHAGDFSTFRGRDWGRPVDPELHRGHQFLGYLQNHDQVGNRALGDRISAHVGLGRVAAGAALVLTSPFTPMLFMGEEWAASTPWQYFTDFDAELGEAVRRGRVAEFADQGWSDLEIPDPQSAATREASVLDWAESSRGDHATMLRWYTELIALRRREPDLRSDDLEAVSVTVGQNWLVVHRGGFDVLVNLSPVAVDLPVPATAQVVLAWPGTVTTTPGSDGLRLPADSVAVVRLAGRA
ncbi:MAG: malto-oligosyltrehalose trehalohydrolase [Kineosporiaceae bacterium]